MDAVRTTPLDKATRARLLTLAGAVVFVLMAFSARYGYHRDELYFVAATDHLAWGYVDQPPLAIWFAWVADSLASGSVVVLRFFPALAMGVVVFVAGLIGRALGGGRRAVLLGAAAVATSGIFLATGHLFSTTTFDILFWSVILYLFVRILGGGDARLWLAIGATAGFGLLNKHLVLYLLLGLLVGLLATSQRRLLLTKWPWLSGLLALAIWSPNLIWQAQNDWPTFEMLQSLRNANSGLGAAIEFLGLQLPFLSIVMLPIAVIGVRRMFQPKGEPFRPIGAAFLTLVVLMLVSGGKGYYIVPFYVALLPMGMVEMEERWESGSARFAPRTVLVVMVMASVLMSAFFLPVAPADRVSFFNAVNPELGETIGWEELVDQVSEIHQGLPEGERRTAAVFTASYGEAGAIDMFGPDAGLPSSSSGHNAYWMWGPPRDGAVPVIVVGYGDAWMERACSRWEPAGIISNSAGVENEEMGLPLAVCHEMRSPWSEVWHDLRHYN